MGALGAEGARILADFLQTQVTSLSVLHLNYNELGDEGVSILLEPFAAAKNALTELSLTQNEIGQDGVDQLVRSNFPNLQRLILEENEEMPKAHLKKKYGNKVVCDKEGDDVEMQNDEDMDALIDLMAASKLA